MKKLALILTIAFVIVSCGKKEESQTTTSQDQQYQQKQTQTQLQATEQTKQETSKTDDVKKDDSKKKDDEKKKEEEKNKDENVKTEMKTKDENVKKSEEISKTETKTDTKKDIDFAQIFSKRCAKCHGKDLKGKPDGGPDLTRSETQNKSDSKLFKIISNGVKADDPEAEDMPAFKNKLTEEEINASIKFIKEH